MKDKIEQLESILIIRLSAIGDVIHALPVAKALRESYPNAEISWIVESKAKDLVMDNPNLDDVILLPKEEWKAEFKQSKWTTLKQVKDFFVELKKKYDFDLALDVHGLFKSGLTAYLSGADRLIGPGDCREGSWLFYDERVKLPNNIHQIDRNLTVAKSIGAESKEISFDIAVSKEELERVDGLFSSLSISNDKKLIAINPFTSWTSKDWFKNRFAVLADRLVKERDCQVVFTGGPADKEEVDEIIEMMDKPANNLAGKTSLKELAEVYKRSNLFIGGDTGPMHLAVAMNTKVIALMGPTTPVTHGPYGKQHIVIQSDLECIGCWDRVCSKNNECMKEITVDQVFTAASEALGSVRNGS
ncbi:glycosyltransferase family 9 protein [Sporohalobacter salinus]|uniref:glycosyltransferase family 9 protein n=1 Tax=Sporohalobacter salinus TaxID=1494606 RepID=UPI001960A70B|nr:glycosyltransferase family 9 protein [Sporohalobacter salinus]MBM7622948.1 lipopolysaccharide heptosyltransferase I [Sporohalobacter salinus]